MKRRQCLGQGAALGVALLTGLGNAYGQSAYPNRPIRLIVPYPPGGPTDIVARSLAQRISGEIGQQMVVENRPGANGNIGGELVAKSASDGYTLLFGSVGPLAINPALYQKMPFDTARDLTPISLVAELPLILVVNPALPVRSLSELVSLAKARPGGLTFGSSGNGSTQHLAGELFRSVAGIDLRHVPYKGAAPAMNDLLGGQIDMMIDLSPTALPHVASGRLKPLAVTTGRRLEVLPELPTFQESGFESFRVTSWFGIFAPAGTSGSIVSRLNAEVVRAVDSAESRERIAAQGAQPVSSTSEALSRFLSAEIARWAEVVRASGARID